MKKREINIQTGEETVTDLTAEEVSAKEAKEVEEKTPRVKLIAKQIEDRIQGNKNVAFRSKSSNLSSITSSNM